MLPGSKLRFRRVWSNSCAELAVLGRGREVVGIEQSSPQEAVWSEAETKRGSAESLESGYATCSVQESCDCDPDLGCRPLSPCTHCHSVSQSLRGYKAGRASPSHSSTGRNGPSRAVSLRHSSTSRHRHSSRAVSLKLGSGTARKDNVVHWKAKV